MNDIELQEYFAVEKAVSDFDLRLLTIKGWGVTLSLAALGWYRLREFIGLGCRPMIIFGEPSPATMHRRSSAKKSTRVISWLGCFPTLPSLTRSRWLWERCFSSWAALIT